MTKLPFSVTLADAIHRTTIYGILGFCLVGTGSIAFNVYMNSDFARINRNKLKFDQAEYDRANTTEEKE